MVANAEAPRAAGQIYDLGYQRYTGERRGRGYAFRTLLAYSLNTAFGIGRGQKAAQLPSIVVLLVVFPAIIPIGMAAATGQTQLINYAQQLEFTAFFYALFVSGQAPELLVGDRETGTVSLYLSRSLRSTDYAIAKLFALALATLVLCLAPQLMMFFGKVMLGAAPWPAFKTEYKQLLPMVGGSLLVSFYMASVGLFLSSLAVKKNSGTALVISFFVILPALAGLAGQIAQGDAVKKTLLINPFSVMNSFAFWLYDVQAGVKNSSPNGIPGTQAMWVLLGTAAVAIAALLYRYRKAEE